MVTDDLIGKEYCLLCQYEGPDKLKSIVRDVVDAGKGEISFTPYNYSNNTLSSLDVKQSDSIYLMLRASIKTGGKDLVKGDYLIGRATISKTGLFKKEYSFDMPDIHVIREFKRGTKPVYIIDGNYSREQYVKQTDERYLYGIPAFTDDLKEFTAYESFNDAIGKVRENIGIS